MEVPAALAGVESVTSLDLSGNHTEHGWEHLQPPAGAACGSGQKNCAGGAQGAEKLEDSESSLSSTTSW